MALVVVLLILWGGGFALHIGGSLIHLLLVIALVVLIVRLLQGRSGVAALPNLVVAVWRQGGCRPTGRAGLVLFWADHSAT
jgi:hypothetical protein